MPRLAVIENPAINKKIGTIDITSLTSVEKVELFLTNFIKIGFVVGSIIFFFMLLWGAFEYITAGGDKDRVGNASKRMSNALIGMVILLSLYALARLINQIFGINLLNLEIPVIQ